MLIGALVALSVAFGTSFMSRTTAVTPARAASLAPAPLPFPWSDPLSLASLGISELDWDSTQSR